VNYALRRVCLRVLAASIASLMVLQTGIDAQSSSGLVIQVVEANAGQNMVSQELPPSKMRVMDRTGLAISGANVTFAAPEGGSFGHFLPNATQVNVTTDAQGFATGPRFRTTSTLGDYDIQVLASYKDSVSRVEIPQSNVLKKKGSNKKLYILSAVIGGAAAAALASKGGGSSGAASEALGALATPTVTLGASAVTVSPAASTPSVAAPAVTASTSSTIASNGTSSSGAVAAQPPTQTQASSPKCLMTSKKKDCR